LPFYTRRQLHLYYDRALALDAARRADRAEESAMGFGGGKSFTSWIKALRGPPDGLP
jgi:hypothetical protein